MSRRPTLTEYVVLRTITVIVSVTALYVMVMLFTPIQYQTPIFHLSLFLSSQFLLVIAAYFGARQLRRELTKVENYLSGANSIKSLSDSTLFFTQEFENINLKLINILRKVKRREKEKRKYTAKIKLKNRQRSDMLSAIAHEFRNPIAAIMGYSQTLTEDEDIPAGLRLKFLGKIYNNGEKIEELLSRLLLWNRFESGNQKLQLSKFAIKPLAREIATNLEDKYRDREIIVEGEVFTVKADKALVEIVIKNLIENALKYSTEEILITVDREGVSVTDKGVGISQENIDKVTKKFFRTDEHSWDNSMGLGLAIVKQILKLHDTTLHIKSQESVGSTFSFKV